MLEPSHLMFLGVGSLLTVASVSADTTVQSYFKDQNRLGGWEEVGNFWGTSIPSASIAGGLFLYGVSGRSNREREAGIALLEGYVVNALTTMGLKLLFNRLRPDASDRLSLPSGHTSFAFLTAGGLMELYGPAAGVPALALGVLTAASRMADSRHWLSDTVLGATLGYAIGTAFAKHHRPTSEKDSQSAKVSVVPVLGKAETVMLQLQIVL